MPPTERDGWDKLKIIGELLIPVILALFTGLYSHYESAQKEREGEIQRVLSRESSLRAMTLQGESNNTAKASAIAGFLPYVRSGADSTQVAAVTAALVYLGYSDLAGNVAKLHPSAVHTLGVIALGPEPSRGVAVRALTQITASDTARRDDTLSHAANALVQAQTLESAQTEREWAIVTGGFGSREGALADATESRSLQYPVAIYHRNGTWRTAMRFPSRKAAREKLAQFRAFRSSAYIVDWLEWCPDVQPEGHPETFQCARSEPERPIL